MAWVIAHRGARSIAPENTLLAAQIAHQSGADLWETDVNLTKDGQLILFHDENLLRCTNVKAVFPSSSSYFVRDFNLEDIKALDAGSYFADTDPFLQISEGNVTKKALLSFKNETIPTLAQGLQFTKKKKWKVNLELKYFFPKTNDTLIPDKTLDIIYQTKIDLNRVIISSFHHEWLDRIMKKEPHIEVQALVGDNIEEPLDFGDFQFPTYNANADLITPDQVRQLKSKSKKINLFTVNDQKKFSKFDRLGVDGMFTDFPQLFVKKNL
ncbi:MAG: hypothetical protein GY699_17000 [Desulfobacteraceae bacterium]|nr:hypothetical protein [Desulfobacteraceae bacterium]